MKFPIQAAAVLVLLSSIQITFAQTTPTLSSLARDIERVESVREVKDITRSFVQLAQFGFWSNISSLFAPNATLQYGNSTAVGPSAISSLLESDAGTMDGIQQGSLNTLIAECPVVNLAVDGVTAKARWNGIRFQGDGNGGTRIEGGVYENEYVFTNGSWKISLLHYFPLYEGPYIGGWRNAGGGNLSIVPYHFTADEAGVPILPAIGDAPDTNATAEQLAQRITRLHDEDAVRNLQDAYGYYVDRRMWTDVVDLFSNSTNSTHPPSVKIHGTGTFNGSDGILQALRLQGPENLTQGILNEHMQLDTIVSIYRSGQKATTRGIEIGFIGDANTRAGSWEFNVFRNRFIKDDDGVWKFKEINITPLVVANYSTGWGNGSLAPLPDRVPGFLKVSGRSSKKLSNGTDTDLTTGTNANLTQLGTALARSAAYDGAENLASAYGYYADDLQSVSLGEIHAVNGHKEVPFTGFYRGKERIVGAMGAEYGYPNLTNQRTGISFHWLMQPVILVADDGRSASLRARLFQPSTYWNKSGTFEGGMYADQFVLENGTWKIWSTGIDEFYWNMANWTTGWSGANPRNESEVQKPSELNTKYPPDLSLKELGSPREDGFNGGSGRYVEWPEIQTMWFPYRNLVSGRVPERYWPGCVPCRKEGSWNLTSNGYLEPPTGP